MSATDAVLQVTETPARAAKVVGKLVEFFGEAARRRSAPPTARRLPTWLAEYGATSGFLPVDDNTLAYYRNCGPRQPTSKSRSSAITSPLRARLVRVRRGRAISTIRASSGLTCGQSGRACQDRSAPPGIASIFSALGRRFDEVMVQDIRAAAMARVSPS